MRSTIIALGFFTALFAARVDAQEMETKAGAPKPSAAARRLGFDPEALVVLDETQTKYAKSIGRDVVCLCGTCPKEPIADCTCGWAGMNRRTIQQAVKKGMSREEIVAIYREVYGDQVLAMLPNEGFARAAWLLPYTAGFLGLALEFYMAQRYLRRTKAQSARGGVDVAPPETVAGKDDRDELKRELNELD